MKSRKLSTFLKETKYCNFNHPKIKNLVQKIVKSCISEREKVITVFNWVKENIKFEFGYWGVDAVSTLKKRGGMCTNKSNLLIAFLRALKIPAGYGILKINTSEFYGSLMCPLFKKLVSPKSTHIYIGVFLEKKWIRCDPSLDNDLAEALKKKTPFSEFSGFDLKEKEIKKIKGVLERKEFLANIDKILSKPPKNLQRKTIKLLNQYLLFLRSNKKLIKKISTPKEMEKEFIEQLKKEQLPLFKFFEKKL